MDILEEVKLEDPETYQIKKGYKLRYGNLSKAWNFVEAHVSAAMENYRKTIDHLQTIVEEELPSISKTNSSSTTKGKTKKK
jgi:hypothetical protein